MATDPQTRGTTKYRVETTPLVILGAALLGFLGALAFLAGCAFLVLTLIGRAPPKVDTFTIIFDLVVGATFLTVGALLARIARRKVVVVESTDRLELRNDRTHHGAGLFAGAVFSVVALACFAGLIVAHLRGSTAISSTPTGYFLLEGLSLLFGLMMGGFAVFSATKFFDRSVRLELNPLGLIHHSGVRVAWSEISDLNMALRKQKLTVIAAALCLDKDDGETLRVDIFGLDQEPKIIFAVAKRLSRAAQQTN